MVVLVLAMTKSVFPENARALLKDRVAPSFTRSSNSRSSKRTGVARRQGSTHAPLAVPVFLKSHAAPGRFMDSIEPDSAPP
jgi:hypothetical protein